MPGTITTDQSLVRAAEVVADYLVLGTFATAQALNDDIKVEGANAINGRVSANSAWSLGGTQSANTDLTAAGTHVWIWLRTLTWPSMDTKANGGLGISISSDASPTLTGTSPSNGPTNSKTWYLAGSDTDAVAGWVCYCVDPNGTPDLTLGTPDIASVDRIGLRAKVTGTVSNKTLNIQHDVIRYGTGLTIKDGTDGSPVGFVDIFTADSSNTNAWGVITQQAGIYFLAGKLKYGTTGQTAVTVFKDTNQVLVWQKFPVASTFYEWVLAGAASFNTTFQLGTFSGGLASGGCTVKGSGSGTTHAIWTLTANAANTICKLYGSIFSELKEARFRSNSEVKFCTFQNFASVYPGGAAIENTTFQDVKTGAPISGTYALIVSAKTDLDLAKNLTLIACNKAIQISTLIDSTAIQIDVNATNRTYTRLSGSFVTDGFAAGQRMLGSGFANAGNNVEKEIESVTATVITVTDGTGLVTETGFGDERVRSGGKYTFDNFQFSGNTYDVENTSAAPVVILVSNGGDAPSVLNTGGGSTTTIVNAVTVSVTVKDTALNPIENARVRVTATETVGTITSGDVILAGLTNASGLLQRTDFNYESAFDPSGLDVNILVRKATGSPLYKDGNQPGTIVSAGLAVTMTLGSDE